MAATSISWAEAIAWRARRHQLHERAPRAEMLAVVSRLCGVHAQVMSSAELTRWARVADLERAAVADALWEERTLVKTWAMRGTLHLLATDDLPLYHGALATYRHYGKPGWLRGFRITAEDFDTLLTAVPEALRGRELTREELAVAVARASGSAAIGDHVRGSWGSLLKPAAYRGELCFAPGSGSTVRFTNPHTWVGEPQPRDPDESLREVVRRYVDVHGPATREDVARWWATSPAKAGKILQALGDAVHEVDVEGTPMWLPADADPAGEPAATGVRLLPAFDQYVIAATRHVDRLTPVPAGPRIYRPQGWLTPVLTVDGRIDGLWRLERKGRRVLVSIDPLKKLTRPVRTAAEAEAESLARFLEGELELTWS